MHRFRKKAVHRIPEYIFQPQGNAARRASHAAGQVNKQRMITVHGDLFIRQLFFQPERGGGIAQKQSRGMFVIHKITVFIRVGQRPALFDRSAVISLIFFYNNPFAPEEIFFPLPGVRGHMHHCPIADGCAHNADAQSQISCRAHLHGIV